MIPKNIILKDQVTDHGYNMGKWTIVGRDGTVFDIQISVLIGDELIMEILNVAEFRVLQDQPVIIHHKIIIQTVRKNQKDEDQEREGQ